MADNARRPRLALNDDLPPEEWHALRWKQLADKLDESEAAKRFVGEISETVNQPVGAARGVVHNVEGLVGAGALIGRVLNPFDEYMSPPGASVRDQVSAAVGNSVNGWRYVAANPRDGGRIIGELASDFYKSIEPSATPMAPTLMGEVNRRGAIGRNQGEFAFDVASLVRGGPALKGLTRIGAAKPLTNAQYAAVGFTPAQIAAWDELYTNLGHHVIARRWTKGLPESVRNHPAIMLKPERITKRQMNEEHFRVDPRFHGAKAPVDPAGPRGWSGKKLGIEKYGLLNRLAFGTPTYANALLALNALGVLNRPKPQGTQDGRSAQNLR